MNKLYQAYFLCFLFLLISANLAADPPEKLFTDAGGGFHSLGLVGGIRSVF